MLPEPVAWLAFLLLALSLASAIRRHLLPGSRARVRSVLWSGDGNWTLELGSGEQRAARLLDDSFVHPRLTVLVFATGVLARRSVVLTPGSVPAGLLRRLRSRLRCQGRRQGLASLSQ